MGFVVSSDWSLVMTDSAGPLPKPRPTRRSRSAPPTPARLPSRDPSLDVRLSRARMVLLRRGEDRFGWLALCVAVSVGMLAVTGMPADARADGVVLLVPRIAAHIPARLESGPEGPVVSAGDADLADLVENELVCLQQDGRPLAWYRVLRTGGQVRHRRGTLAIRLDDAQPPTLAATAWPVPNPAGSGR